MIVKSILAAATATFAFAMTVPAAAQDMDGDLDGVEYAKPAEATEGEIDDAVPGDVSDTMMRGLVEQMTGLMGSPMMDMPLRELVGRMGLGEGEIARLEHGTMRDMLASVDPAMIARMQETLPHMIEAMPALIGAVRGMTAHMTPPETPADRDGLEN